MSDIFISYRRQDSAYAAAHLADSLSNRYGNEAVSFDVDSIAPGADFKAAYESAIASSKCVLVVIGPTWLGATDAAGQRRLDDPNDSIRSEVASALQQNKLVVPILISRAGMPSEQELPLELREIAQRQAFSLRSDSWDSDIEVLGRYLDSILKSRVSRSRKGTEFGKTSSNVPFITRLGIAFDLLRGRTIRASTRLTSFDSTHNSNESPSNYDPGDERTSEPQRGDSGIADKSLFVSHSGEDRQLADQTVQLLESRGCNCWIAHRDIPAGTGSWAGPIVEAIANSRLFLVLVTKASVKSTQVLREVTLADAEKIPLMPVLVADVELSTDLRYFFTSAQRLEIPAQPIQKSADTIRAAVEKHLKVD